MTLDVSQLAVIIASGFVSLTVSVIGWRLRKHAQKQEAAAVRREQKQELHYRKLDAVIFALASASEHISGVTFRRAYEEKMREYRLESQMMGDE